MQIFTNTNFDFMGKRLYAAIFSAILVVISIVSLATQGLEFGLDFTGGTVIELGYQDDADLDQIRSSLTNEGYDDVVVQNFGSIRDVLIRLPVIETEDMAAISNDVVAVLQADEEQPIDVRRVEFVGPQVGDDLIEQGGLAVLYAMIGILIYIAVRFEYRLAASSILGLIYDITLTMGYISVFRIEFDLTVLAAVLAIIGYSLNDTIVVFDRIREGFLRIRKGTTIEIVNRSINDTLSRTIMTSFTTMLAVFALFYFAGDAVHSFAAVMLIGIVIGTYSSIYVSGALALLMGLRREDLLPPQKENSENINADGSQV